MNQKSFNRRVILLGILVSVAAFAVVIRLASLHFSSKIRTRPLPDKHEFVRRGVIKDSTGSVLAMSLECRSVYANPGEVENSEETSQKLAAALGLNAEEILKKITRQKKRFVWIKRKLSEKDLSAVTALNLAGIHFKKEYIRIYPHGKLAAHLVGFVNSDNVGIEGIEYKYDDLLTSYDDYILSSDKGDFKCGNSVVLTIDRVVQHTAETELEKTAKETGAKQGVIIVTEVKSGKILALAKYPSYDPNNYSKSTPAERSFFTVTEPFEPGSTMKIFSAGAAITARPSIVSEKFICHGGVDISDAHINCTGIHYSIDLADSIKYSCNVGIISAIRSVNSSSWNSFMRAFGFGEKTGFEIAGESSGILRGVKQWSGLSKYSTSIGQELSVTSLQLAAAYGAIANDGVYYSPYLVDSIVDIRGEEILKRTHPPKGRAMRADIARELKKMLVRVVDGGTGKKAAMSYYHAGGKTGTAQKSIKGVYIRDKNISSFAGIAPIENPDICIIVIIDEPQGVTAGSVVAAPVFASVAERVLPYRGITYAATKQYSPVQTRHIEYEYTGKGMPSLAGRQLSDAAKILASIRAKIPIDITVEGSGTVYAQKPAPGTPLGAGSAITLYLRGSNE